MFEGRSKITERLFLMHQKLCPYGQCRGSISLAEIDDRGNMVQTNDKRRQKLIKAALPQIGL